MPQILMIGPALQGGISRVINMMLCYAPANIKYTMVKTTLPENSLYAAAHLRNIPARYYFIGLQGFVYFTRTLIQLRHLLHQAKPDLAHIHFSAKGSTLRKYFVSRQLHRYQVPYILHAHGGGYREFYYRMPNFVKNRILWMVRNSQGLIALSELWYTFYQGLMGDCSPPIWVMANPVELPRHWSVNSDKMLRLLFLGRMDDNKGTDRILHALARLPEVLRAQTRLYMAGDGDVEAMRHLAHTLGLQAQVDIRDWIEGDEKQRWLQETNTFILPSRAEGLPMAMLEAMAYGKALIVSPVGGIPEFVTDGQEGLLVPPDDVEAISQAIAYLIEHPDRRVQMGHAARKRIEPLDVKIYMARMVTIYESVLSESSNRSK